MAQVFTKRFIFQLFGIASIFLFLLTNLFQPNYWSIKTAGAISDGFGISLDDNASYSTFLNAHIINNGPTPAGPQTVEMGVFHCNTAGTDACAPDLTPNDMASDSQGVTSLTIDLPAPGTSTRTNISVPSYSCGRVQVDFGWPGHTENGGIVGGRVFNLGSDCAAPPPVTKTANLSSSCPDNTPTLSANWNVGSGSSCNIYIQAGSTANQISTNCSGSASLTSLAQSGAVVNGGTYRLFASDGSTTTDGGQVTVNCAPGATPAPSATPVPSAPAQACPYGSTQARWQKDASDPWASTKTISTGQSARAGSFHDNTGQFATDTTLTVTGPSTNQTLSNEGTFTPSQAGTYQLKVTTNGKSGPACEDTATLTVTAAADVCPYTSTQARVQRNLEDPWDSTKTINVNEQIRVGGFHNHTGQFADDVNLNVTGPMSFSSLSNGQFITPAQVGTYALTVTTQNQTGPECEESINFLVNQPAASPTPTPTPTPEPTATPSPIPTVEPTATPAPTATPVPAGAPTTTVTVNPTITSTNTNTQSQSVNVTQQQTGNVGVAGVAAAPGAVKVTELPKTGLPALAWSALAFLPAGFSLKKFGRQRVNQEIKNKPDYIWTHRRFRT